MSRFIIGWVVLLIAVISAGCGAEAPALNNVRTDARVAVCQSLGAVRTAVAGLTDVNPETPVAELRARKQQADTLVEALRRANEVLQNERITQFIGSYGEITRQIDSAGAAQTLGQAATAVAAAANAGLEALDQATAALQCAQ